MSMIKLKEKPVRTKNERQIRRDKIISFIVLALVSLIWIIPLLYMLGTSFKTDTELQLHPESLFPTSPDAWTIKHYEGFVIRDGAIDNMPLWMLNSLWSTAASVVLTLALDLITAYAVVFLEFRGKKFFMKFLLLWMAIPGVIGTAPSFSLYAVMRNAFGFSEGASAYMYIYSWFIVPGTTGIFNMLLMRNFFASIPKDIVESARSDGAGNAKIFFKIVCPLAKSTMMLIILFTFAGSWNNLMWPQMLLTGESSYWQTVTVALSDRGGDSAWSAIGINMATAVFSLLPILIVFLITQNKMIDGLASTGVKR